jgi:hypothetical protein
MALNLQLKFAIFEAGYPSQRDFAYRVRIPENRLSEIVRGWVAPRDHERAAIAAALGKSEDHLFRHQTAERPA